MSAIIAVAVLAGLLFNLATEKFPADDGFFYLQIANNVVHGMGSTFHGVTGTNGYHPLWMIVCVAASLVSLGSKGMLIHVVWAIQMVLFVWALVLFRRFDSPSDGRLPLGECLLTLVFIGLGTLFLIEAHLHLLILLVLLLFADRMHISSVQPWFWLGVIAGLFVLSRLDGVFVGSAILLGTLIVKRAFRLKHVALLVVGGLLIMAPYLLYNQFSTGHIVPVSGVVKSTIANPGSGHLGNFGKMAGVLSGLYLLLLLTVLRKRPHRGLLIALTVGCLVHVAYSALFQKGTGQWYWVAEYLAIVLMLNDLYRLLPMSMRTFLQRPWPRYALLTLLLVPTVLLAYLKLQTNFSLDATLFRGARLEMQREDPAAQLARQLDSLLPPHTTVMVYDTPGRLAYYSHLRIFPSDGLMSDFNYGTELETLGTSGYLHSHGVSYVLSPYSEQALFTSQRNSMEISKVDGRVGLTLHNPLNGHPCGTLELTPQDTDLVAANPLVTWQPEYPEVALWKVPEGGGSGM